MKSKTTYKQFGWENNRNIKESSHNVTRITSIDIFRGLCMMILLGMDDIFRKTSEVFDNSLWQFMGMEFTHCPWNGIHIEDIVFPSLIFASGMTIPLVFRKKQKKWLLKVIKRICILVILGILYNINGQKGLLSEVRFPSVLGRIGISWGGASIIYCLLIEHFGESKKLDIAVIINAIIITILCTALLFVQAPDYPAASLFSPEGNFIFYIDRLLLPGKLQGGNYDSCGIVGSVAAIVNALLGIVYTRKFLEGKCKKYRAIIIGVILFSIGLMIRKIIPINKNMWTASFILITVGCDFIINYIIIKTEKYGVIISFFVIMGTDTIYIYLLRQTGALNCIAKFIFGIFEEFIPCEYINIYVSITQFLIVCLGQYFLFCFIRNKKIIAE